MRDNRFAAHVRILLPFAAEIASKFDPIETRIELAALLASDDFKQVGNSEAHHMAELEHFRILTGPIGDEDVLRMGAFLASDSSETMYIPGDKAGHAFEAFDQLVERACVHMIQGAKGRKRTHDEWVADHYRFDQQEAVICVDDFEDALRAAEARGRAQAVEEFSKTQDAKEEKKVLEKPDDVGVFKPEPSAWSYYKRYGIEWFLEFSETPLESNLLRVAQITPLYAADQISKAVAAEMERCIEIVDRCRPSTGLYGNLQNAGDRERNEGIDRTLEAIRRTAK